MKFPSTAAAVLSLSFSSFSFLSSADGARIDHCSLSNFIAPTYDDGPSEFVPTLLTILKNQNAKLTFFTVGNMLESASAAQTLRQMDADGHHIAMHTYSHADLETLSRDQIADEIIRNSDKIVSILGENKRPRFFRCPYGSCGDATIATLESLGLRVIHWSSDAADTNDWRPENLGNRQHVVDVYAKALGDPGNSIFLQHDTYLSSVEAANDFIPLIRSRGKQMGTVGACLGDSKLYYSQTEWKAIVDRFFGRNPGQCSTAEIGIDYFGNDLRSTQQSQASACCADCAMSSGCKGYTWTNYNGGTCWLKTAMTGRRTVPGAVSSTFGASPPPPTPAPTPAPTVSPTPPPPPPPPSGQCSTLRNVDFFGNDIASTRRTRAEDCCGDCKAQAGCQAFTWSDYNGGTCWLKSRAVESGAACPSCRSATVVSSGCPNLVAGTDYFGADITNRPAGQASGCCELCKAVTGCRAFTWTSYNGGTCWLKSSAGNPVPLAGAVSGAF